ncbi:MAG: DUF1890 domain-containing protein [Methanomicrobiales archaeon]|jgi:hypothetical protein|nr:DUF1890 domain-containing protein [Methanomicrobiales archaeon]
MTDSTQETPSSSKTALILLGCPKIPIQTSLVLYLAHRLKQTNIHTTIAGTPAARQLIRVADPAGHYIEELMDLDACIDELAEEKRKPDSTFVYIHNDAGISYAATVQALCATRLYVLIFGENASQLEELIEFPCTIIADSSMHNPMKLKKKLENEAPWDV